MTVFIDTNILVCAHDPRDEKKALTAIALLTKLWSDRAGALSTQVPQEFFHVATGKLRPPMSAGEARQVVADYAEWAVVETTPQLIVSASVLHEQHDVSFRDALIVEAALLSGADTLLTEDLQHGQRFEGLTAHNPFRDHQTIEVYLDLAWPAFLEGDTSMLVSRSIRFGAWPSCTTMPGSEKSSGPSPREPKPKSPRASTSRHEFSGASHS